jgi:hypothetical protein
MSNLKDKISSNSRPGTSTQDVTMPGGRRPPTGGGKDDEGPSLQPTTGGDPDKRRAGDDTTTDPVDPKQPEPPSKSDKKQKITVDIRDDDKGKYVYNEVLMGTLEDGKADGVEVKTWLKGPGTKEWSVGQDKLPGKYSWNSNKEFFMTPDGRKITSTDQYKNIHKKLLGIARDMTQRDVEKGSVTPEGPDQGTIGEGNIMDDDKDDDKDESGTDGGQTQEDISKEAEGWSRWLQDNLTMKKAGMALNFPGTRDLETRNIPSRLLDYRKIDDVQIGDVRAGVSRYMPFIATGLLAAGAIAYLSRTGLIGIIMGWDDPERLQKSMNPSLYPEEGDGEEEYDSEEEKEQSKTASGDNVVRQRVPSAKVEQPTVRTGQQRAKKEEDGAEKPKARSKASNDQRGVKEL